MFSQRTFEDAPRQEMALPRWQQKYTQLSSGKFRGEVALLQFGGLSIVRERINVAIEQWYFPPKDCLFFFGHEASSGGYYANGRLCPGRSSGFGHGCSDRLTVSQSMTDTIFVVVEASRLNEPVGIQSGVLMGAAAKQAEGLQAWLGELLQLYGRQRDAVSDQARSLLPDIIQDRVMLLLDTSASRSPDESPDAAFGIYRRLIEWLDAYPHEPATVTKLAAALGVSRECLRQTCLYFTGRRLEELLLLRRLNGAHRALIAARGNRRKVSDIALDWGFFHWGRFAVRYRSLFGETPSQTLRAGDLPDTPRRTDPYSPASASEGRHRRGHSS